MKNIIIENSNMIQKIEESNKTTDFNTKPLLYIIGAAKTATTWLWEYLEDHEQVFVTEPKEVNYFNCKYYPELYSDLNERFDKILDDAFKHPDHKKLLKESQAYRKEIKCRMYRKKALEDEAYYMKYFKKYVTTEKCFVDITPLYCGLEHFVFEKMSNIHPNTKFMFIMRDPLERCCPYLKQMVPGAKITDEILDYLLNYENHKFINDYKHTIENLEKVIPKENILYCFYENLFCDETIKEICDFLGIEFKKADYKTRPVSAHDSDFSKKMLEKIFNSQKDIYEFIFEKFGENTPVKWHKTYNIWCKQLSKYKLKFMIRNIILETRNIIQKIRNMKIKDIVNFINIPVFTEFIKRREFNKKTLLYVVGAMKTGTNWLWEYFETHKQVLVSYPKEMHYFNCKYYPDANRILSKLYENMLEEALNNPDAKKSLVEKMSMIGLAYRKKALQDETYYLKYFKNHIADEKCFTDITPTYCGLDPIVFEKMSKLHPNTKFMFIMRDPVERYCSGIKQAIPASEINDDMIYGVLGNVNDKNLNNYKYTIESLEKVIPKENILYCFYENLFCDDTIKEICDFLEIEFKSADYKSRYGYTYDFNFSQKVLEKIFDSQKESYEFVFEKFGVKTPAKWHETYKIWSNNCLTQIQIFFVVWALAF